MVLGSPLQGRLRKVELGLLLALFRTLRANLRTFPIIPLMVYI